MAQYALHVSETLYLGINTSQEKKTCPSGFPLVQSARTPHPPPRHEIDINTANQKKGSSVIPAHFGFAPSKATRPALQVLALSLLLLLLLLLLAVLLSPALFNKQTL